ncbi:hypothetical protein BDP27DRAFT_1421043 [Rhodocollybia butyracea]|uniref:ABM domain-containing protein n=1 Tax=Rhodocollybia butyracea TaxID=206335 RepID=A0A9P5U7V9_9AGAR|nr:hypothetical protein BDP27DRAFT_1421043 [Rhodocollybia butyracea]
MSLENPPKSTPSGRLMLIATITAKAGKEAAVATHLKDVQKLALSDDEPGTSFYRVTRRVDVHGHLLPVFVVIEDYAGAAGLRAHIAGAAFQKFGKALQEEDLLEGEIGIDYLDERKKDFEHTLISGCVEFKTP